MGDSAWESYIADFMESADLAETTVGLTDEVKQLFARKSAIKDFFKVRFTASAKDRHFAYFTNRTWRKFLLSIYYADILSYPVQEDQVDFPRLCYILSYAPQGFTVWWAEFADGRKFPIGYTGWYSVAEPVFQQVAALAEREDRSISHRFFLPAQQATGYLYLFNYSIVQELKGTRFSHTLIKDFAAEINSMAYRGLFCATVSGDGRRVAEKFKMKKVGAIWDEAGQPADNIYLYQV
ncbi:MAG: hypothetical protein U0350_46945 [Caldilineaceae bacterium]